MRFIGLTKSLRFLSQPCPIKSVAVVHSDTRDGIGPRRGEECTNATDLEGRKNIINHIFLLIGTQGPVQSISQQDAAPNTRKFETTSKPQCVAMCALLRGNSSILKRELSACVVGIQVLVQRGVLPAIVDGHLDERLVAALADGTRRARLERTSRDRVHADPVLLARLIPASVFRLFLGFPWFFRVR